MASSITLKSSTHGSRYLQLECTQKSNGSVENSSTISWKLSAIGDSTWYSTGPTKVVINGTTVYSKERVSWSAGTFPVAQGSTSGTLEVPHNTDGTKTITVKFSTAIYTSTVSEYSETWTLDSIPRYATSVQSLNAKTETTIKMNWSSDSTIDYIWYSKDNGSNWTGVNVEDGKSGTYTISGLTAKTKYNIKTRVRRKDSQLTTDSTALSVETYDYPYCTDSPNFTLGDALTLKFYNPLSREFKFYIIGNGKEIDVEYNCSSTSYTGVNNPTSSVPYLYATIPNAKSGKYQVKVVYGSSTKTRNNGNTYNIKESECYPVFTNFTYKDGNTAVTSVTGSNQILVKGLSKLTVDISSTNKMKAKNSATPKSYTASIDKLNVSVNYSENDISKEIGVINTAYTSTRLNVTAYDSRTLSKTAYKDVVVYDYAKPVINASVKRLNNFEAQTTLNVSGEYSKLTINGADKNTLKSVQYRYREDNGTWGSWANFTTTLTNGKFTCNDVVLTLDNTKAFEFEIVAVDNFGDLTKTTKSAKVDIGQAIFFISSNKRTAYLNGEEIATKSDVRQTKYYTQLAENTDLNKILETGTYRSIQASHTDTMSNVPAGLDGGFTLYVLNWTATPTNTQHRRQELIYGRMTYVRRTIDGGATWSEWNATAYLEDLYPVGAIYCNKGGNPQNALGGRWAYFDKGFYQSATNDTTAFTPATNVTCDACYISRSFGTVRIRLTLTINTTMNDTGMELGNFNWNKVGITALPMGYGEQMTYSDGANGGIVWNVAYDSGKITQLDVFDTTTIESGKSFALDMTFTVPMNNMIDSFCDKFFWKRIS